MKIELKNISKSYGDKLVFDNFNISFEEKKITSIVGASGIGKSTLLNIFSDLTNFEGTLNASIDRISYIFQDPTLIPSLTVKQNLEFILKSKLSKADCDRIIEKYLGLVGLGETKNEYPSQLSIGMEQRVSIARAFAFPSDIILMDEPFRGLDVKNKNNLIKVFLNLWEESKKTVVMVTHNIDEAVLLADKIYILGGNPCKIVDEYNLSIPQCIRKLSDIESASIYNKIYNYLINEK